MPMTKLQRRINYFKGLYGEWLSEFYFRLIGYHVLARRYRSRYGEIDLIVAKKLTKSGHQRNYKKLAFVEVKTYRLAANDPTAALGAVSVKAQKRIKQTAAQFLQQSPDLLVEEMRFDVVVVSPPVWLSHLRVAFDPLMSDPKAL